MIPHEHSSSTLQEGTSSACVLLHSPTLSTSWWEAEDSPPCPGLLTGSPLQRTMEHLRPEDRLSSPPFLHMPSLHSSSTRYWHFCLATSPLGSHEGVVFFILVSRGTLMLAGLYWQMLPPQPPQCSVLPLPIAVGETFLWACCTPQFSDHLLRAINHTSKNKASIHKSIITNHFSPKVMTCRSLWCHSLPW